MVYIYGGVVCNHGGTFQFSMWSIGLSNILHVEIQAFSYCTIAIPFSYSFACGLTDYGEYVFMENITILNSAHINNQ
jgi:hypothetical protein